MDNMNMECHYAVQERILKCIWELEELTKLREKEENIMREKLKEIQQATFELNEAQRKYTSWTVQEKAVLENLRLYSSPPGNKKQKWRVDSDPPYVNERHITSSTPGFMFQPNDEYIFSLLKEKSSNPCQTSSSSPIKDCSNLYRLEPWHLPGAVGIKERKALYFYVQTKKKSETGDRKGPNGFWKATGSKILRTLSNTGYRRTLKYLKFPDDENDRSSKNGKPTNWIMHEYRLAGPNSQSQEELSQHWTICKITSTEKNIEVPNHFSKEGSIDPSPMDKQPKSTSPMEVQPNSTSPAPKHLDNNGLAMEIQDEARLQFGEWTQEQLGKFKKQRMNREIHQSDEATPCYATGIHSTRRIMVPMHEVETGGVEPQQFENPGKITKEFGPSISERTSASLGGWSLRFVPSISEHTSASSVAGFPNQDFIGKEDENQSRFEQINSATSDDWWSKIYPSITQALFGEDEISMAHTCTIV